MNQLINANQDNKLLNMPFKKKAQQIKAHVPKAKSSSKVAHAKRNNEWQNQIMQPKVESNKTSQATVLAILAHQVAGQKSDY